MTPSVSPSASAETAASRARRAWPHLRAALILLHVVAVLALASPAVQGGLSRQTWRTKAVQAELRAWGDRVRAIGVDVEQREFEDFLWDLAKGWTAARGAALAPFKPYARYLGAGQAWQLFVAPQIFTSTATIDVEEDGVWRTVFADNDARFRWNARKLEYDRVQSLFFWFGFQDRSKEWRLFAEWTAREVARDFPAATRVRLRMLRTKTPSIDDVRAGVEHDAKYDKEVVVDVPRGAP